MKCIGCDLGAMATKTVIVEDGKLIAFDLTPNQGRIAESAKMSIEQALVGAALTMKDIDVVVGTGWGAKYIPVDNEPKTVLSCLAIGGAWLANGSATLVDIGGLSTTLINIDKQGKVSEYRTNDRCASGTGFFMELAAQALELSVADMGDTAKTSQKPVYISGQCAVFGESEIVSHINDGAAVADIAAGLANSVASGVVTMARRLGVEQNLVFSGGLAKNRAIVEEVEKRLEAKGLYSKYDPQIVCALGAALSANGGAMAAEELK